MSEKNLWFGFLDAGKKSSAVLIDDRLSTGTNKTVYIYTLARGQVLEYDRAVIEPKLRELARDELGVIDELKAGYNKALQDFRPRGIGLNKLLEQPPAKRSAAKEEEPVDEFGYEEGEEGEWSEGESEEEEEEAEE